MPFSRSWLTPLPFVWVIWFLNSPLACLTPSTHPWMLPSPCMCCMIFSGYLIPNVLTFLSMHIRFRVSSPPPPDRSTGRLQPPEKPVSSYEEIYFSHFIMYKIMQRHINLLCDSWANYSCCISLIITRKDYLYIYKLADRPALWAGYEINDARQIQTF